MIIPFFILLDKRHYRGLLCTIAIIFFDPL